MFKNKLNTILLIDDDEPTNFFNEMIISQLDCTENIVVKESGIEALDYLKSVQEGQHPQPDLIFLDINMPAMNGWEFLEEYENLEKTQKGKVILVMLTTSLNPDDRSLGEEKHLLSGFMNKPLTEEAVISKLKEHFPKMFNNQPA